MKATLDSSVWTMCYEDSWKGFIVDEAFAHPAKFARGLIDRIYDYCFEKGYLKSGDTVVDPFGGVGLGGVIGAGKGLKWIGCELEPKFVDLAKRNFDLHRRTWQAFNDPNPVMVCGDSRELRKVLGPVLVDACVGSPPFNDSLQNSKERSGLTYGNARYGHKDRVTDAIPHEYGNSPGQLGSMTPGSVDSVISSPPYANSFDGSQDSPEMTAKAMRKRGCTEEAIAKACTPGSHIGSLGYGSSRGQLGSLPEGSCESPEQNGNENSEQDKEPSTFWESALVILRECHAILKPGGIAVWVLKAFVRGGQIQDFPGDWRRLCEHVGFQLMEEVHASLVKEETHPSLFGGNQTKRKERKSFFRRLHEKKRPDLAIDFEVVLIMRRP